MSGDNSGGVIPSELQNGVHNSSITTADTDELEAAEAGEEEEESFNQDVLCEHGKSQYQSDRKSVCLSVLCHRCLSKQIILIPVNQDSARLTSYMC